MIAPKNVLLALASLAPVLMVSGCKAPAGGPTPTHLAGDEARLAQLQPGDVAVAPVRNQTGLEDLPSAALREAFGDALVGRMYSPLDDEYVDGNWVESSFRGTPGPDALLVVAMTRWDTGRLFSTGQVVGAAEVVLFEGGDTTGTPLWTTHREVAVSLAQESGAPPTPSETLIPRAASLFAEAILADLPARDPVAAHP